jgi:large subunit ribosomal protein L9
LYKKALILFFTGIYQRGADSRQRCCAQFIVRSLKMKVILNQDVKYLGEEGDIKTVANGYARNYLFPRRLAVPHSAATIKYFESKKTEIDERKKAKRTDAQSLKERLEAFTVEITMSSGPTGKLYGAVTNQTVGDILNKNGFDIERKRIEIPGLTIKHTGKYSAIVHLYESVVASVPVMVTSREEIEATKRKAAEEERAKKRVRPHKPDEKSAEEIKDTAEETEAAQSDSALS